MVGGRGVRLEADSVVRGDLFLALDPRDDGRGTSREARVGVASLVRREWLEGLSPGAVVREKSARFDEARGRVVGVHVVRYRDLVLEEDPHVALDPEVASKALADALVPRGLDFIREQESAATWLARYELLTQAMPERDWPALDDEAVAELIGAAARGKRAVAEVRDAPWVDLLRGRLSYAQSRLMDAEAPEALTVPSGNRVRLRYEPGRPPVLAVRLQELFGWAETPHVADGRVAVQLHLLGPNYRPVQVTDDLRSFWSQTYFQVRKDLRNRYPKHAWPDDPLTARAEAKGRPGPVIASAATGGTSSLGRAAAVRGRRCLDQDTRDPKIIVGSAGVLRSNLLWLWGNDARRRPGNCDGIVCSPANTPVVRPSPNPAPSARRMTMKAILSWLGDPYLHLIGIGTVVVSIGLMSSGGEPSEPCGLCNRPHDESRPCPQVVATSPDAAALR